MRHWLQQIWQAPDRSRRLAGLALILFALAAVFWLPGSTSLEAAALLTLAGGVALGVALWQSASKAETDAENRVPTDDIHSIGTRDNVSGAATDVGIPNWIIPLPAAWGGVKWRWVFFGMALLWLLAEVNGAVLQQSILRDAFAQADRWRMNMHLQMLLLIMGMGCVVGGLIVPLRWTRLCNLSIKDGVKIPTPAPLATALHPSSLRPHLATAVQEGNLTPLSWWRGAGGEVIWLIPILLLAFGVRVWNLENEVHTFIDEMSIVESINVLHTDPNTFLLTPYDRIAAFPWVWSYHTMLITDGLDKALWTLRLPSALYGTLAVIAVYLLARRLFDAQVALVAALLMATFPPHVHLSRLAMLLIGSPAIGTLALYFAVRAVQTHARRDFVLCGALLGALNFYHDSGRLVYPALVLLWYGWLWLMGRRAATRRGAAWLLLALLLISAPILYTRLGYRAPLFARLEQNDAGTNFDWGNMLLTGSGMANLQRILHERVVPPFLMYLHLPDTSAMYYGGSTAMILPFLVPLVLAGVWHCVWRPGAGGMLLVLWVVGVALGNSLIRENTWTPRFVDAMPGLVLLLAVGLVYTGRLVFQPISISANQHNTSPANPAPSGYKIRYIFLLAFLLSMAQAVYYFGVHLPEYRATIPPFPDYSDVAFRAADLPRMPVYFVHSRITFVLHFAPLFEWWGADVKFVYMPWWLLKTDLLAALPDDSDYAFFIDTTDIWSRVRLWERFGYLPIPEYSPYNLPRQRQYLLYRYGEAE